MKSAFSPRHGSVWHLRAGWLIDGQGGPPRPDICLSIKDAQIQAVAPFNPAAHQYRPLLDLSHATVLPALMDAHVHLALPDPAGLDRLAASGDDASREDAVRRRISANLLRLLYCGIAAVRDGGDRHADVMRFKKAPAFWKDPLPHLAATCWAWHARGRYGGFIGRTPGPGEELAASVEPYLCDCDHLKLIQSGLNSLEHFGRTGPPQFPESQLRTAAEVARRRGIAVMIHANGEEPVRLALAAGCSSIEHGYFMGEENLECMAGQGTFWVPTIVPMAALADDCSLQAGRREVAARTRDHQLAQVARAQKAGVRIALGTDSGSPGVRHGESVRQELELLMAGGLTIGQAVRSTSLNAAELMGLALRGALMPGWRADLIVVPERPQELPGSLAAIEAMFIAGQPVPAPCSPCT